MRDFNVIMRSARGRLGRVTACSSAPGLRRIVPLLDDNGGRGRTTARRHRILRYQATPGRVNRFAAMQQKSGSRSSDCVRQVPAMPMSAASRRSAGPLTSSRQCSPSSARLRDRHAPSGPPSADIPHRWDWSGRPRAPQAAPWLPLGRARDRWHRQARSGG